MTSVTAQPHDFQTIEPFRDYAVNWSWATVRTDTPDLLGLLERVIGSYDDGLLAEAYDATEDARLEAHSDLAEASYRSLAD